MSDTHNHSLNLPSRKSLLLLALVTAWTGAYSSFAPTTRSVLAQDSSLLRGGAPLSYRDASLVYIPIPPPQRIQLNDTVVVRVDELARVTSEAELERRSDGLFDALLLDWIELIGLKAVKPSPQRDGDQRIRGQLQELLRAEGDLQTRESLAFNIACSIVDIRPNGTLVLEGHKQISINDESWDFSLSGICRREDIGPDNTVLSRNIVEMKINKRERGSVRDSYKRGWLLKWIDEFHPF